MFVSFQDKMTQLKNPVADVHLITGKSYIECDIVMDTNPNPNMISFIYGGGAILFVPTHQIARIEMYDLPEDK